MNATEFKAAALKCNNNDELNALILTLSGTDNRFVRQEICNDLTGQSIPIVKAGISHLADYTRTWMQAIIKKVDKKKDDIPKAERRPLCIGVIVKRKACGRQGTISAIEGDKLTIELADGDVRRPNINRFYKLYTC